MSHSVISNHTEGRSTQNSLLQTHLMYLRTHSPFYRDRLMSFGPSLESITVHQLSELPMTSKDDLSQQESAFLCRRPEEIVEYVTTSGTLGPPVTFMLTESDLQRLAHNEYMSLLTAGCSPSDIIQIMVTLDKRFMAGIAYYLGARKLGAGIVRTGVESLAFQLDTIQRMGPTVLIAVPSFVIKLIDFAQGQGIDMRQTTIEKIICIGEPIKNKHLQLNPLGERIKKRWPVQLYSTYASTEMATAFTECAHGIGGHEQPDLIVTEILDPNGQPVRSGEAGEVVVTPLGVTGMPLLRFKTGDICRAYTVPCACGKKTMRLGPVEGRQQQMIKLKGTSLYPPALFDILNGIDEIDQYLITLSEGVLDTDHVLVEFCSDSRHESIENVLREKFTSYIRVVPQIRGVDKDMMRRKTHNPMSRKSITLLDLRKARNDA